MLLTVKNALDENAQWHVISAKGLQTKMQTGLTQIYWQWQQKGRPAQIEFMPENQSSVVLMTMSKQGVPVIEANKAGCEQLLSWFVDEQYRNDQINLTTTFLNRDAVTKLHNHTNNANGASEKICKFEYAQHVFLYHLFTGNLNVSS